MGGAQLLGLFDDQRLGIPVPHRLGHIRPAMARHNNCPLRRERGARFQGVHHKRRPTQRVENLRQVGIHPCALTGGQNNQSNAHKRLKPFLAAPSIGRDAKRKVFGVHKTFRFVTPTVTEGGADAQRDFRS